MTTPASNTPYRAICLGLQDAGLVPFGAIPSSELLAECMGRLNDLIAYFGTQGIRLWLQQDLSIPLVSGQAAYSLKPGGDVDVTKPLRILPEGYYLDSSNNKRTLTMLSRSDYMRLSRVVQTGAVSQFFVDKLRDELSVYFWLVPDATAATGTAHLLTQFPAARFTELSEGLDFPQEWFLALRWGLASEVSVGQPLALAQLCQQRAAEYLQALSDWDVEDADTRFSPDLARFGATRRFR